MDNISKNYLSLNKSEFFYCNKLKSLTLWSYVIMCGFILAQFLVKHGKQVLSLGYHQCPFPVKYPVLQYRFHFKFAKTPYLSRKQCQLLLKIKIKFIEL